MIFCQWVLQLLGKGNTCYRYTTDHLYHNKIVIKCNNARVIKECVRFYENLCHREQKCLGREHLFKKQAINLKFCFK